VRAALELAASDGESVKGERIAEAQGIPLKFLENILQELRHAGVVRSQRGPEGGYRLARPAGEISLGEVIRAVDGPLASVRGEAPEDLAYEGSADALRSVWVALRANLRAVLDEVSVGEVAAGKLPAQVERLTRDPGAWTRR